MTLIQRQDALVAKLEPVYKRFFKFGYMGQDAIGIRSKAKRLHREEMEAAGYTKQEAIDSAQDCDGIAYRNADHAEFMAGMGVPA